MGDLNGPIRRILDAISRKDGKVLATELILPVSDRQFNRSDSNIAQYIKNNKDSVNDMLRNLISDSNLHKIVFSHFVALQHIVSGNFEEGKS